MKVFFQWLTSRSLPGLLAAAAGFSGVIFLGLSVFSRWFLVPEFSPAGEVRGVEPAITWVFRAACVAVAFFAAARREHAARLACALLLALLLYPTAVLHSSPGLAARAAWLAEQHDQLTSYAGDIYTSQEVRDATWQQRILVVNQPLENHIFELPAWSPANIEWGRFFEITEWYGLSAWFGQSLARGWVLAVAGVGLLLLARGRELACARRSAVRWLAVGATAFALAALPFCAAAHFLSVARDLVRSGEYQLALTALDRAASAVPAIREDGAFFLQVGRLESESDLATPAAEFFRARRLAEDGFFQQAEAAMLAALPSAEPGSVWQRELVNGLLVRAGNELNSGQSTHAIALLEAILAADPCNLTANYRLQIACVRSDRLEELRLLADRMRETYRFLNTPTKRPVLAAAQEHLAAAELQGGTAANALAHSRNARSPWK